MRVRSLIAFRGARVAARLAVGQLQNGNRKPQSKAAKDSFEPMGSTRCHLFGLDGDIPRSNILTQRRFRPRRRKRAAGGQRARVTGFLRSLHSAALGLQPARRDGRVGRRQKIAGRRSLQRNSGPRRRLALNRRRGLLRRLAVAGLVWGIIGGADRLHSCLGRLPGLGPRFSRTDGETTPHGGTHRRLRCRRRRECAMGFTIFAIGRGPCYQHRQPYHVCDAHSGNGPRAWH